MIFDFHKAWPKVWVSQRPLNFTDTLIFQLFLPKKLLPNLIFLY
jgi:hypothetical protein